MKFEESLNKLEELSNKIRLDETSLDEAFDCYEEGMKEYEKLKKILDEKNQKIEVFEDRK